MNCSNLTKQSVQFFERQKRELECELERGRERKWEREGDQRKRERIDLEIARGRDEKEETQS